MTIKLNEPVITSLLAKLQTGLPAIIADINTNNTAPPYLIDNPAQVLDYIPTVADLFQFPTLGISDGPLDLEDDVGFGATGVFELSVVIFLVNSDQRALAWQLRRYAQAVVRTVRSPNLQIGEGWGTYNYHVRPGPTLGRDRDPAQWISTVGVSFMVKTEQDG